MQTGEIVNQVEHFFIAGVIVEGNYRDSIVDLEGEAVHRIINDDHILKSSIANDSEILNVKSLLGENTVLSVHSELDKLSVRINIVENCVRICLVRSCEHHHLEMFVCFFQALHHVRPYVNPRLFS